MTIKSIIWFTCGGTFASLYANKASGNHMMRRPHVHLIATLGAFLVGYQVHLFEESYVDRMMELKKQRPLAPIYAREELLTYQAMIQRKAEQATIGDVDSESFDITEDEEDDE